MLFRSVLTEQDVAALGESVAALLQTQSTAKPLGSSLTPAP